MSTPWEDVKEFVHALESKIRSRARKYSFLSCYEPDDFLQSAYVVAYEVLRDHGSLCPDVFWVSYRHYVWRNLITVPRNCDAGTDASDISATSHCYDSEVLAISAIDTQTPEDLLILAEEPVDELPEEIESELIEIALQNLSPLQRETFEIRLQGLSQEKVAQSYGVTYQAIQDRERRGIRSIQQHIEERKRRATNIAPFLPFYGEHTALIMSL